VVGNDGDEVPGKEKVPALHFWQLESDEEPSWSLKVPAGHCAQLFIEEAPIEGPYVPDGHFKHCC